MDVICHGIWFPGVNSCGIGVSEVNCQGVLVSGVNTWVSVVVTSDYHLFILLQIAYIYTYEMRPYLDMLLALLIMEDSWQTSRIINTLMDEDKDSLFDIIHKSKNNYQKRGYQCIKMLVNLLSR